jgi:hypothetical protein
LLVKIRFPNIIWTLPPTVRARLESTASAFYSAKFL